MNPIIKDQLKKVKNAILPEYNDDTTKMIIKKTDKIINNGLIENKCYLIQVEDYIVNPYAGFTLHDNWNKGTHPLHRFLKCEVVQKMGKMVKVNSVGYDFKNNLDTNDLWCGWLPEKSIKIMEEI